ncbi:MAG: hypothetical protein V3V06_08110 [Dehalococcoidia bacterium]
MASGRTMLPRRVETAAALIAVRGRFRVGVRGADEPISSGDGMLLPAGTVYSFPAEEDSVAVLFALPEEQA